MFSLIRLPSLLNRLASTRNKISIKYILLWFLKVETLENLSKSVYTTLPYLILDAHACMECFSMLCRKSCSNLALACIQEQACQAYLSHQDPTAFIFRQKCIVNPIFCTSTDCSDVLFARSANKASKCVRDKMTNEGVEGSCSLFLH